MSKSVGMNRDVLNHFPRLNQYEKHGLCSVVWVCICVQSLMVAKAKEMLEQELMEKEEEKERYLAEKVPALQTGGMSFAELQVSLCTLLHTHKIMLNLYNNIYKKNEQSSS